MKLTDFKTGQTIEIDSECVIEMHNRGAYREIKAGLNGLCEIMHNRGVSKEIRAGLNGLCEIKYKVTETVPQILDRIREDKRK